MRKFVLMSLLFVIFLAFALDVGFIDSILVGQMKMYKVGESNLSVKLLNIYEEGAERETKVILELNGEETKLLGEDEEDVLFDGGLIIRIYDIFPTQKKAKFQIHFSDVEESNRTRYVDKNQTVAVDENKESINESNETEMEEVVDENQSASGSVGVVGEELEKENITGLAVDEESVEWRRVKVEESRKLNIFVRVWRWFISLFGF